jgi:CheY-like chemotaxis protein
LGRFLLRLTKLTRIGYLFFIIKIAGKIIFFQLLQFPLMSFSIKELPLASVAGHLPNRKLRSVTELTASSDEVSQPATSGPGLVYVVENDYISSVITELIVKKNLLGSVVRCYANGQWAFDELLLTLRDGGTLPSLILLDLDMPLMDGWEFLDALANLAAAQTIRVFVQTSSIQPDDRNKAFSYKQVIGFFSKPLKEDGVAAMVSLLQQARKVR